MNYRANVDLLLFTKTLTTEIDHSKTGNRSMKPHRVDDAPYVHFVMFSGD